MYDTVPTESPDSVSRSSRHVQRPGNPEVRHNRVAVGEQDVARFDIAMDEPGLVGMGQAIGHFGDEADRLVHGRRDSRCSRCCNDSPSTKGMTKYDVPAA